MKTHIDKIAFDFIRKQNFADFNQWLEYFYGNAYKDGVEDATKNEYVNVTPKDCEVAIEEDDLFNLLISVKGVGEKRAQQIIEKLKTHGIDYNLWED